MSGDQKIPHFMQPGQPKELHVAQKLFRKITNGEMDYTSLT